MHGAHMGSSDMMMADRDDWNTVVDDQWTEAILCDNDNNKCLISIVLTKRKIWMSFKEWLYFPTS